MNRLTQIGIVSIVLGGVILYLGLFPFTVDAEIAPGIGVAQVVAILAGLILIVLGAYVITYSLFHLGKRPTLQDKIGVRLGLTGLVFSGAAIMADILGFGSHTPADGPLVGGLQAVGVLIGFLISAVGVVVYGSSKY